MSKAQYDLYLSDQSKQYGQMNIVIFKGNKVVPFKLDDCVWLVYSKKKYYSEKSLIRRLKKALQAQADGDEG